MLWNMIYFNNYGNKLKEVERFAKLTNWLSSLQALVAGSAPVQPQALTKLRSLALAPVSGPSLAW